MQEEPVLMESPSFSSYSSIRFAETADRVCQEFYHEREDFGLETVQETISITVSAVQNQGSKKQEEKEEEFDFSFVGIVHQTVNNISAEEIFSLGHIRSVFLSPPRSHERSPLLQYAFQEPERAYSVCRPEKCKKSNMTGTWKQWMFRDLCRRSNKKVEKVEKQTVEASKVKKLSGETKATGTMTQKKKGGSCHVVKSAHEIHYMKNKALKEVDRHRTFLPYRMELLGLFAR